MPFRDTFNSTIRLKSKIPIGKLKYKMVARGQPRALHGISIELLYVPQ